MQTIAKGNNVRDYISSIKDVANNYNEQFHDIATEADLAEYYATHGRTVIVEPDVEIDLKTIDDETGKIEYIEVKRVQKTFDEQKIADLLFDASGSAQSKFGDDDIDTSDGNKTLEIRIPHPQSTVDLSRSDADQYRK